MKKLIVLSLIFALVAGSVFAQVGGEVIGTVNVMESSTADGAKVTSSATLNRVRLQGSGENEDGTFGAWVRAETHGHSASFGDWDPAGTDLPPFFGDTNWDGDPDSLIVPGPGGFQGYVWWKPIDQVKLTIGGNSDGFFGKEGVTAWMFYQTVSDTGVVSAGNAWGGGYGGTNFREAFYGGFDGQGLLVEINPVEMFGVNLVLPFFAGGETSDVFKKTTAQINVNMDFGNIAFTYRGALMEGGDQPKLYLSFSGPLGPINLDFGFGYKLANEDKTKNPLSVGLGLKYGADAFGVKFRAMGTLAGEDKSTNILVDVLPYYVISDSITAFASLGLAMGIPDKGDSVTGWHFNPYLTVGSEWGPKFVAGVRVWSAGGPKAITNWQVPIAIAASF